VAVSRAAGAPIEQQTLQLKERLFGR